MEIIGFRRTSICVLLLSAWLFVTSCVDTRQATSFNTVTDGTISANTPVPELIIQKNDLLSISVSDLNPEATKIFNVPNTTGQGSGDAAVTSGYLVNAQGMIQFPILGNIKAAGLTKEQLKQDITKKLLAKQLSTDPIVNIRFLNFHVTVIGEVKNPNVFSVPNEKISLLEAIGLAGDLTIYAKRENVLIIREENEVKTFKRLNLNSNELLSSPYYYLKSNDVIYVEPNKTRVASSKNQTWVPAVLSGLSLVVIVLDRLIK